MAMVLGNLSFNEIGPRRYFIKVQDSELRNAVKRVLEEEAYLSSISAVDLPKEGKIELSYIFWSIKHRAALIIKVLVDRGDSKVPSISDIVPGAAKSEIEVYDLVGVVFEGNKSLRRGFLAPEDVVAGGIYPLRKDSGV